MNTPRSKFLWLIMLCSLFLTACGGGSSGSGDTDAGTETGKVQMIITDAEEDFLSYKIELLSVSLSNAAGREVDLLSTATEVDFVQYQDLSELFAIRSIPAGRYDSILLELDYSNAEIIIQDETGTPYFATPVDSDGNAITRFSLELQFGDAQSIIVNPARIASLTLDLDLSASNTILAFDPAEVLVEPFLMASVETETEREHRARGLLQSVDEVDSSFAVELLPMRLRNGSFGEVRLYTNSETLYEIDGLEFSGATGLSALAEMAVDTPVVAYGAYDEVSQAPLATQVFAGTSVPWDNKDVLRGTVTSRSGNSLTLAGAVIETAGGSALFARAIHLEVDDDTPVTGYRFGDANTGSLSVGQQILALGSFNQTAGEAENADIAGTFDATDGLVQMRLTSLLGSVESEQPLSLALGSINRRPIEIFDFSGTGSSTPEDADPAQYEIDTASLNTTNLQSGEWILVRGYPAAFGAAPDDFQAVSITDPGPDHFNASLSARWDPEAQDSINIDGSSLSLNLDEGGSQLRMARIPFWLSHGFELNSIEGTTESGRFAVQITGESITIYSNYTDFLVTLTNQLNLGEARQLTARGEYNSIDAVLTAGSLVVRF